MFSIKLDLIIDQMKICIAFFRGINISGNNIIPMSKLMPILEGLGKNNITTYVRKNKLPIGESSLDL
jgi:hypothetical protein